MRARFLAPALAGLAPLAYLTAELYVVGRPAFPLDDAWIHLHFASQLAAGEGLAYNPGEWVAGSSAPLWTALLSLGFMLPASLFLLWPKVLGVFFLVATVLGVRRLARELGLSSWLAELAGVLTATTHWLVWASLSGMEVTLFAALSLWGLALHLRETRRRRGYASSAVLAAACLARPEGLLLLASTLLARLLETAPETGEVEGRRDVESWRPFATALLVLAPVMVFYTAIGGSPAPSTLAAKTRPDLVPSGAYLRLVLDVFYRSQPVLTLLALAGALQAVARRRPGAGVTAAWLLGLPAAYSLLAAPGAPMPLGNFGRYYMPLLPLVVVFGLLALEPVLDAWRGGVLVFGRRLPARGLVLTALLVPQVLLLLSGPARHVQTVTNVEDSDVRAARWLSERLPPEALLAVQDVGALKFFLPNQVIDLAGLVTPEVVEVLRAEDGVYWEERLARYLAERRPDYLVVFSSSYPRLSSAEGFERVATFEVEDNVTMAGDELVILSTPWTDQPLAGD